MINYMNTATYSEGEIDHDAYYLEKELFYDLWEKYVNGANWTSILLGMQKNLEVWLKAL